jgi:hypothetical protein
LAAKAAEYVLTFDGDNPPYPRAKQGHWNPHWSPLESDGDALRLAVKLNIRVRADSYSATCDWWAGSGIDFRELTLDCEGDPYAATRRAIVRAAAEIGRAA